MNNIAIVDGHEVKVGDWVSFKADIEQSGKIIKINGSGKTATLDLEDISGFEGGYIGGETLHTHEAERCWLEG